MPSYYEQAGLNVIKTQLHPEFSQVIYMASHWLVSKIHSGFNKKVRSNQRPAVRPSLVMPQMSQLAPLNNTMCQLRWKMLIL